jgi:hypothetical protein
VIDNRARCHRCLLSTGQPHVCDQPSNCKTGPAPAGHAQLHPPLPFPKWAVLVSPLPLPVGLLPEPSPESSKPVLPRAGWLPARGAGGAACSSPLLPLPPLPLPPSLDCMASGCGTGRLSPCSHGSGQQGRGKCPTNKAVETLAHHITHLAVLRCSLGGVSLLAWLRSSKRRLCWRGLLWLGHGGRRGSPSAAACYGAGGRQLEAAQHVPQLRGCCHGWVEGGRAGGAAAAAPKHVRLGRGRGEGCAAHRRRSCCSGGGAVGCPSGVHASQTSQEVWI